MSLPSRDVKESEITVDNLSPCTQYNFAVAAVLDGDAETEKSVSEEVTSPLDENEDFEAPNLVIHNEDRSVSQHGTGYHLWPKSESCDGSRQNLRHIQVLPHIS